LPLLTDPNLIVGPETCDDAGVYRLNDESALIQTVDFFTPIVDDPLRFGQIAAANALSDVYAMGGRPLLAMNLVAFPIKTMDMTVLKNILQGGLEKLNESRTLLVGGHSIEDPEIKYGLSVTGVVHPDRVILNAGARPGDQLLLTKPIGLGILATALKGGLTGSDIEPLITEVMATLNRQAAEAMAAVGAHGCTDITGFGLLGHLYEMARASKTVIRLRAGAVPLLPDALRFAGMGIIPEGAYNNRSFYGKWVENRLTAGDPLEMVFYDPQTSGGLLIAAPPAAINTISVQLAESGYDLDFAVIGEVSAGPAGRIVIEP
jgi:selenide,water dikinase